MLCNSWPTPAASQPTTCSSCSGATVEATAPLTCLTLDRATFTAVLGPLQQLMSREKSAAVTAQRLMKLQSRGGPSRVPAEVLVRRRRRSKSKGTDVWEVIRARGHLDEVLELRKTNSSSSRNAKASGDGSGGNGGSAAGGGGGDADGGAVAQLVLTEGNVLGGGAFSRVSIVTEQTTGRTYALKRMRKSAVVQCPEHVFCEQTITRNLTHPFCIRQYASFQVGVWAVRMFLLSCVGGSFLCGCCRWLLMPGVLGASRAAASVGCSDLLCPHG